MESFTAVAEVACGGLKLSQHLPVRSPAAGTPLCCSWAPELCDASSQVFCPRPGEAAVTFSHWGTRSSERQPLPAMGFAGPSSKCKCRGPCATIIRSFKKKVRMAKHLTQPRALCDCLGQMPMKPVLQGPQTQALCCHFSPGHLWGLWAFLVLLERVHVITTPESTHPDGIPITCPLLPFHLGRLMP